MGACCGYCCGYCVFGYCWILLRGTPTDDGAQYGAATIGGVATVRETVTRVAVTGGAIGMTGAGQITG